jgi:hypothetical protein
MHGPFAWFGDSGSVVVLEDDTVFGIIVRIYCDNNNVKLHGRTVRVLKLSAFYNAAFY